MQDLHCILSVSLSVNKSLSLLFLVFSSPDDNIRSGLASQPARAVGLASVSRQFAFLCIQKEQASKQCTYFKAKGFLSPLSIVCSALPWPSKYQELKIEDIFICLFKVWKESLSFCPVGESHSAARDAGWNYETFILPRFFCVESKFMQNCFRKCVFGKKGASEKNLSPVACLKQLIPKATDVTFSRRLRSFPRMSRSKIQEEILNLVSKARKVQIHSWQVRINHLQNALILRPPVTVFVIWQKIGILIFYRHTLYFLKISIWPF